MRKKIDLVNQSAKQAGDDVLEAIHRVMHLARALQHRGQRDSDHELTPMDGRVLGYFARHPGATPSDLAQHTGRDKGQLARLIGGLRERGLLDARPDEHDRRITRLHLTPAAQGHHQALLLQRQRLAEVAAASLDADERRQLLALLEKVRSNLEAAG